MHPVFRWILALPAFIASSLIGYAAFNFIAYVVRTFNIVPQENIVDLLIAAIGANFIGAAAGVMAGSYTAPRAQKQMAIIFCVISIAFPVCIVYLAFLNQDALAQPLYRVIIEALAWIVGAISGAYGVISGENDRSSHNNAFNTDADRPGAG